MGQSSSRINGGRVSPSVSSSTSPSSNFSSTSSRLSRGLSTIFRTNRPSSSSTAPSPLTSQMQPDSENLINQLIDIPLNSFVHSETGHITHPGTYGTIDSLHHPPLIPTTPHPDRSRQSTLRRRTSRNHASSPLRTSSILLNSLSTSTPSTAIPSDLSDTLFPLPSLGTSQQNYNPPPPPSSLPSSSNPFDERLLPNFADFESNFPLRTDSPQNMGSDSNRPNRPRNIAIAIPTENANSEFPSDDNSSSSIRVVHATNGNSNHPMTLVIIFLGPDPFSGRNGNDESRERRQGARRGWVLYLLGHGGEFSNSYEDLLALQERIGFVHRGITQNQADEIRHAKYHQGCIDETRCPVCLVDFLEDEDLRTLPCNHNFHKPCIDTWLVNHCNSCPLCREPAIKQHGSSTTLSSEISAETLMS